MKNMVPAFLSDVVGLDLTKYNMINEGCTSEYPSYYGGEVKVEVISFDLVSDRGSLSVMGIFCDGFIYRLIVYYVDGSVIFSGQPSTDAVDESRNILQRYKTFAQNLGWDTSHVDQASAMLNSVSRASSNDNLHMFNNITGFVPNVAYEGNVKMEATEERVRWIHTEEGAEMTSKSLSIDFGTNKLSFADKWNLYKVGSLSVISEDEAKSIGWEAARNYNVAFTYENGTTVPVTPKWSNVSEIDFNMVPGQKYKQSPEENFVDPGSVAREPLSLYPAWRMIFYFEMIGSAAGVQVGVWGDTKEIAYISLYGYLGAPAALDTTTEPPSESSPNDSPEDTEGYPTAPNLPSLDNPKGDQTTTSTEPSPESTQLERPTESGNSNPTPSILLIGGMSAATVTAIALTVIVFKKRRK